MINTHAKNLLINSVGNKKKKSNKKRKNQETESQELENFINFSENFEEEKI